MTIRRVAVLAGIALAGMAVTAVLAQAQELEATLSQMGLAIAPVPLNLAGKDPTMVGLGSYFVNSIGDCNGCHTGGGPPNFNYAPSGNPYFHQRQIVDPTVYLSGGQDFGTVGIPTGAAMYAGPHIIARNLTPDKTGLPAGGRTLSDFLQIMTSGTDFDHLHPTCTAAQLAQIQAGTPTPLPVCIPASLGNPTDGDVLQVMPWPSFSKLSQYDLQAIYTYLSAIPCITGPSDPTSPLHNDCGSGGGTTPPPASGITIVITGPGGATSATNTFQATSSQVGLDASGSSSAAGGLTFSWQAAPGYPSVSIPGGLTATPLVQLTAAGTYELIVTVTDASGASATATVTLQFS